ncbi:aldehyde dehydrogenase family protein [Bradyrhizobium sp. U87765 SZCCT0131]|uniref:aldehyde dehydrogenase family protein n=1 Tax=unclassified Bradyrhizobium TaxID=2631580 RepID=UPI001BA7CE9B|nr:MULTISPECIES: aldehyde dehydrogenase family protein [unclassified Bradyrhizobium]MBR1222398.1 aldehyde dehydrogenase family protein [Bradyrhizobium sp. U87765 SZCCT0131]MBR1264118.1 aldehyde dehydrogenase family protein [Bradyrhizobium sp. U87765 SZCCT0134]MBR1308099.1 aldehyde dehydrogenase family protein [Bradyrhizobium sp. U87765 SZCCT0110]MBR1320368.1 aldehyde dehydrogenase family protein [Bradyrhizobium sp. U87765 SZCCT0109]MBR1348519.1 aldehyde dehydrogenase family protein [Bradyrhizo
MSVAHYYETMDYGPAPEADGEARAWLKTHGAVFDHFIAGAFTAPKDGVHIPTIEPATGKPLARLAQGSAADIDAAVAAARQAQVPWAKLGGHGRARHLYALSRMLQRHARLFAVLEAIDNGKPIRETRDLDVPLAARHFLHHAGWAQLQERELSDQVPLGVVGQIIPWNFPLLMLAWKIAPALAVGNTVVLKPAEFTSLTALLFAELAAQAGLPPGVLNVVTGDGATGAALVAHPDVDKIAFTGSTEVGRLIREATAGTGKSLTLELGGKSPFIVFDDADIDGAIEGVVDAIWFNQGQVCCAGSRLLVHEGIAEDFRQRLVRRMETLRVGSPLDKAIDMGAVVAPVQLERIKALVETGVKEGAQKYQAATALPADGCFYPPTLLWNVQPASTVAIEEIFGPVLVAMTFRTPDEAVALANNTRYGLAASVWSETIGLALDIAPKLLAGVVWINATNLFDAAVGFGGYRESGFGREGGREGIVEYLKPLAWAGRKPRQEPAASTPADDKAGFAVPALDRTAKLFVGGKQVRPDGNYSRAVVSAKGKPLGEVGEGNRKDVRNAVAAARAAEGWARATAHNRAQILYYLAENLSARRDEFAARIAAMTGISTPKARAEVDASISRLFSYGAWADKYDGAVHAPPLRGVALAMHEPIGVVGVACPDEAPLLAFISLVAPLIAMGNRVVAIPSERHPLAATDLYQVLETSDVPAGVVNIVTGGRHALVKTLAEHDDVDALWVFGSKEASATAERLSSGNLKRTLVDHGLALDWSDARAAEGEILLRHAVQVKNIWIPYGD